MARTPKPVVTIRFAKIAASLQAQNEAVMLLVTAVHSALRLAEEHDGWIPQAARQTLREKVDACQVAMWPEE